MTGSAQLSEPVGRFRFIPPSRWVIHEWTIRRIARSLNRRLGPILVALHPYPVSRVTFGETRLRCMRLSIQSIELGNWDR